MAFLLALSLSTTGVKELLRDPYHLALIRLQLSDELKLELSILIVIGLNSGYKLDKSLLIPLDALNKSKVATIDPLLDSDPGVILESSLAHLIAHVQYLGHLRVRNHFNLSPIDPLNPMNKCHHMRHIMSLDIDPPWSLITVEH